MHNILQVISKTISRLCEEGEARRHLHPICLANRVFGAVQVSNPQHG